MIDSSWADSFNLIPAISAKVMTTPVLKELMTADKFQPVDVYTLDGELNRRISFVPATYLEDSKELISVSVVTVPVYRNRANGNLWVWRNYHTYTPTMESHNPIIPATTYVEQALISALTEWRLSNRTTPTGLPLIYSAYDLRPGMDITVGGINVHTTYTDAGVATRHFVIYAVIHVNYDLLKFLMSVDSKETWQACDNHLVKTEDDWIDDDVIEPLWDYIRSVGYDEAIVLQPGLN